jgi:hypothetical protein
MFNFFLHERENIPGAEISVAPIKLVVGIRFSEKLLLISFCHD